MRSLSGFFSYLFVGVFFYLAITKATTNPSLFLNLHGLAIVFGGILVAGLASFPWTILKDAVVATFRALNTKSKINHLASDELLLLSMAYQKGLNEFERVSQNLNHSFVKDSANLILEGIQHEFIIELLEKRINEKNTRWLFAFL